MKKKTTEFTMFEFHGGPKDGLIMDVNWKYCHDNEFIVCSEGDARQVFVNVYKLDLITKKALFLRTSKLK